MIGWYLNTCRDWWIGGYVRSSTDDKLMLIFLHFIVLMFLCLMVMLTIVSQGWLLIVFAMIYFIGRGLWTLFDHLFKREEE